ncbi:hypothetical protein K3495_g9178 [Podosphaera aphanis]|nr:hypothetical protein K3495_g9178 [Podosphaera aphanis]
MKLREYSTLCLFYILPAIYHVFAVSALHEAQATIESHLLSRDTPTDPTPPQTDPNAKTKFDVGTKDAPVDGLDGKPHAGPWVSGEKDAKKTKPPSKPKVDLSEISDVLKKLEDTELRKGEKIPAKNDGVMNDPAREIPKHGTTGTGGGVSEKDKARKAQEGQTGERLEKNPPPYKTPTTIEDDKAKGVSFEDAENEIKDSVTGLGKPNNLPGKLNNLPHPLPDSAQKDHLEISDPKKKDMLHVKPGNDGLIKPLHSFILSLTMILFSEVGDKTFLIAALMAMKHDRLLVFSAAFSALLVMTILSAVLGHAVPTLVPKRFTNFLAAALFLMFGARTLKEGLAMSSDDGVGSEMKEVEMELEEKENLVLQQKGGQSSISPYALEMGFGRSRTRKSRSKSRLPSIPRSPSSSPDRSPSPADSRLKNTMKGLNNLLSLLLSPAWVQTFVMTFLGEWGDRSQIATIAMAAGQDYWWVCGGAVIGHSLCTGVAVIGGRAIAGRVSLKLVTLCGAISFLSFGVIYFVEACYS